MKLTLEQHRELSEKLKEFRETMMQPHVLNVETSARKAKLSNNKAFSKNQLRDQFAGLAMQGMISTVECEPACEWIARTSYEMADAMLEARGRHPFC